MLPANTWLDNRYRIIRQLGGGGMGTVYLAEDTHLPGHRCAIKELSPSQVAPQDRSWAIGAFQQEARLLATLSHAGIVRVSDYFGENSNWYLVMEYIEGRTLEESLQPQGLPLGLALTYIDQIGEVLDYLHRQNPPVIFRDLKPGNVMLKATGDIKLIDFGIARFFKPGQAHNTVNLGTPGYASPEHVSGQADARSDIYSLGVLLLQLVTGYDPTAATVPYLLPPARSLNPQVPAGIEAIIVRATQLSPVQRFQTVAEFRQALRAPAPPPVTSATLPYQTPAYAPTTVVSQPFGPPPGTTTMPPPTKQPKWIWAAVGAIALLLLAVIILPAITPKPVPTPGPPAVSGGASAGATRAPASPTSSQPDTPTSAPVIPPAGDTPLPSQSPESPSTPPPVDLARKVVFSRGDVGCSSIVVHDVASGAESMYHWGNNTSEPAWSPDGTRFVASSGECSSGSQSLVVFTPGSGQIDPIVSGNNNIDPDWGSDNRIYFARGNTTTNDDIYSVKPDGTDELYTGLSGRQPTLSPDGQILAYMRLDGAAWRIHIARIRSDGTFLGIQPLGLPSVSGGIHARMPNWTSDSRRVLFNVTDKNFDSVALGVFDITTGRLTAWDQLSPNSQHFARPSCGAEDWCVANEVNGGLWLLRESNGDFSIEQQLTNNLQDWGADIFP